VTFIELYVGYALDNIDKTFTGTKILCKSKIFEISAKFLPDKDDFEKLFEKLISKL
jgi:hypothetical protein